MPASRLNDLITSKVKVDKANPSAKKEREFKKEMTKKPSFGGLF